MLTVAVFRILTLQNSSSTVWTNPITILPGAAVVGENPPVFLQVQAFRSVSTPVSREPKLTGESETLRPHGYFWRWVRPPKRELFPFCLGSDALAFGRPAADSPSSVQLYVKLDRQGGNTDQMMKVFHLLALPGRCRLEGRAQCTRVWGTRRLNAGPASSYRAEKRFEKMEVRGMLRLMIPSCFLQ